MGMRLWPPARTLATSPCSDSSATASLLVSGAWYVKGAGFTGMGFGALSDAPQEADDFRRWGERSRHARCEVAGIGDHRDSCDARGRVAAEEHQRVGLLDRLRRVD